MKKILSLITAVLCCCLLVSCSLLPENQALATMEAAGISGFIKPDAERDIWNSEALTYIMTEEEYHAYAADVYEFLKNQNFTYFGKEGKVLESFFGALPTYQLEPTEKAEDHYSKRRNAYVFVLANTVDEETGKIADETVITIYYSTDRKYTTRVYVSGKSFGVKYEVVPE